MNIQPSLFGVPPEPPMDGYTRYEIEVCGAKVFADFNPRYLGGLAHIAFHSIEDGMPNPISHTGYYSQFLDGSCEDLTPQDAIEVIRNVAAKLTE